MRTIRKNKMNELTQIVLHNAVAVALIFSYGFFRSKNPLYIDPLMLKWNISNLDGWSLMHFFHFGIIGYRFPSRFFFTQGLGIAWEGFEHFLGEIRPSWLGGFGDCKENVNVKGNEKWWYGRTSDIVVNTIGFIAGSYLSSWL